jgi:hypothetical protein
MMDGKAVEAVVVMGLLKGRVKKIRDSYQMMAVGQAGFGSR